jgi:hypothetical protein
VTCAMAGSRSAQRTVKWARQNCRRGGGGGLTLSSSISVRFYEDCQGTEIEEVCVEACED